MGLANAAQPNGPSAELKVALVPSYEEKPTSWRVWIIILLLALLVHLIVFLMRVQWSEVTAPPRVELKTVDPSKLEEIRKKWRERDKQLLLNKDKSKSSDQEKPDDARYFSDRNIHVDKEQRAKQHEVVPKPGIPGEQLQNQPREKTTPPKARPKTHEFKDLGNLGIPFNLNKKTPPKDEQSDREAPRQRSAGQSGANQYIKDDNIPTGSENLLNAEESVYYSFYARLYEAIGPIWASKLNATAYGMRVNPGDYTTSVDVVLDREGNLIDVKMIHESGVVEFDRIVGDSWRRIGRFPNPPSGLLDPSGEVHTGWNFTVRVGQEGGGMQFLPPSRDY